jgi:protein-tyrosine-phosphatase
LLGAPLTERAGGSEIADPYGRPRSEYERVCQQVLRAVDAWLKPMGAVGPEAAR